MENTSLRDQMEGVLAAEREKNNLALTPGRRGKKATTEQMKAKVEYVQRRRKEGASLQQATKEAGFHWTTYYDYMHQLRGEPPRGSKTPISRRKKAPVQKKAKAAARQQTEAARQALAARRSIKELIASLPRPRISKSGRRLFRASDRAKYVQVFREIKAIDPKLRQSHIALRMGVGETTMSLWNRHPNQVALDPKDNRYVARAEGHHRQRRPSNGLDLKFELNEIKQALTSVLGLPNIPWSEFENAFLKLALKRRV